MVEGEITYRGREIARLNLTRQLAIIDEKSVKLEGEQPAFPDEEFFRKREGFLAIRNQIILALEELDQRPTRPPTLWDRLMTALAKWSLEDKKA